MKFAVLDLETSGTAPLKGDKIIQIGLTIVEDLKITKQYNTFINPEIEISPTIENLTGISNDTIKDAPTFEEVLPDLLNYLAGSCIVAHNVNFDLNFLNTQMSNLNYETLNNNYLDTVELARIIYPTNPSYQLSDLADYFGIVHERPHQADSDAEATALLLIRMIEKINSLPFKTLESLHKLSRNFQSELHILFSELLRNTNKEFRDYQDLIYIDGIYVKSAQSEFYEETIFANEVDSLESYIDALKDFVPNYKFRQGQITMIESVYDNLRLNNYALIEAGTGIGKTLAYLLPAALIANETKSKVIISTPTTLLQQQIDDKDLALVNKILANKLKSTILKGRQNYIDAKLFARQVHRLSTNYDETLLKAQILIWLTETDYGDVTELNLPHHNKIIWQKYSCANDGEFIQSESEFITNFYKRANFFAEEAQLIIVNHSLLLNPHYVNSDLIKKADYLIVDEAQRFINLVTKQASAQIHSHDLRSLINKLNSLNKEAILLPSGLVDQISQLESLLDELSYESDQLFQIVLSYANKNAHKKINMGRSQQVIYRSLKPYGEAVKFSVERIVDYLRKIAALLQYEDRDKKNSQDPFVSDIEVQVREMISKFQACFFKEHDGAVTWFEIGNNYLQKQLTIFNEPLSVGNYLYETLYKEKKSIIFTSATLTVEDDFHYIEDQLCLDNLNLEKVIIPTPFNYAKNVKMFVPSDLLEYNSNQEEDYLAETASAIVEIAQASQGRSLVLFTAHKTLKATYDLITESGALEEYILQAQGISAGSDARLAKNFQKFEKSILFGTNAFWEGVDIQGEALSSLIIVKLPFSHPKDPIFATKSAQLLQENKNPFEYLSLPEAILRFRQGFGRLIRSEEDRGTIVVLDKRIVSRSYGKRFLNSLPQLNIEVAELKEISKKIKFFNEIRK